MKVLTKVAIGAVVLALGAANYSTVDRELKLATIKAKRVYETLPKIESIQLKYKTNHNSMSEASSKITLEASNTVVLKGPVNPRSVARVMMDLQEKDLKLPPGEPIYLVLYTPGGSIFAGLDLIDYAKSLDRDVHTVTLFAASMGFQIAQNLDKRYIKPSGTLMSHRARGGVQGQFDGELETRYKMVKAAIERLDYIASKRMNIEVPAYKKMILNEYWVHGSESVSQKAADEVVNLKCGKSLSGYKYVNAMTRFGRVKVTFSKCPLINGVIDVELSRSVSKDVEKAVRMSFEDPRSYYMNYIKTGLHNTYFYE